MKMKSTKEVLLLVAGILITLLVILFAFSVYHFARTKGDMAIVKLDETFTEAEEANYTQYHGEFISGGTVSNFIKECENRTDGVYIQVCTNKNTSGAIYVYSTSGEKIQSAAELTLVKNARTKTHNDYINPGQMFYGEVIRDTNNNAIIGIKFTEEPTTP